MEKRFQIVGMLNGVETPYFKDNRSYSKEGVAKKVLAKVQELTVETLYVKEAKVLSDAEKIALAIRTFEVLPDMGLMNAKKRDLIKEVLLKLKDQSPASEEASEDDSTEVL